MNLEHCDAKQIRKCLRYGKIRVLSSNLKRKKNNNMDELQNIKLSKRNQTHKTTYCIIPCICNFKQGNN